MRAMTLALALVVGTGLCPAVLRAAPPEPAIVLEYRAGPRCPTKASFLARVASRAPGVRVVAAGDEAPAFVVSLEGGSPATGSVSLGEGGGVRRVKAETCQQVAEALALVVALAIAPEAASEDAAPAPPSPAPAASAAPDMAAAGAGAPTVAPRETQAAPPSRRRWAFFAGVSAIDANGLGPGDLYGVAPFAGWVDEGSSLRPMLRLSVLRTEASRDDVPVVGTESFVWTVGRLDVCRLLVLHSTYRAAACARVEAGLLEVRTQGPQPSVALSHPWLAAGPNFRFELRARSPIFVSTEIGLMFRATHDHFVLASSPSASVSYDVPLYGYDFEVGLGAHFL